MAPPSREAFVGRLGQLDERTLTAFVADLYAARGRETELVADDRFVERRPRGGDSATREVRVVTSLPADPQGADAVVVGEPAARDRLPDGTRVVDATALHQMALYAVDRDRLGTLLTDYFGTDTLRDGRTRRPLSRLRSPATVLDGRTLAVAAAVAVAVALVFVAATVDFEGRSRGGGTLGRTVTSAPVPEARSLSPTAAATPASPAATVTGQEQCPSPPTDAHPAAFRPVPVEAAVSTGLEGWEYLLGVNVTTFYGPTELAIPWTPEIRHESTYRIPGGETIVLTVDRWDGPRSARVAGEALAAEYAPVAVWGQYTLSITFYSGAGNTSVRRTRFRTRSSLLLSQVVAPDGGKLGAECVDSIRVDPNASQPVRTTPYSLPPSRPRLIGSDISNSPF